MERAPPPNSLTPLPIGHDNPTARKNTNDDQTSHWGAVGPGRRGSPQRCAAWWTGRTSCGSPWGATGRRRWTSGCTGQAAALRDQCHSLPLLPPLPLHSHTWAGHTHRLAHGLGTTRVHGLMFPCTVLWETVMPAKLSPKQGPVPANLLWCRSSTGPPVRWQLLGSPPEEGLSFSVHATIDLIPHH